MSIDNDANSQNIKFNEIIFYLGVQQLTATSNQTFTDLKCFLESIGLEKYFYVFEEQAVDLPVFLTLNDNDFQEIGIR